MSDTEILSPTDNLTDLALPQTDITPSEQAALALRQMALQSKTILTIDEAAEILHCAVSTLQTMSIDELPTYEGAGRYTYYLKSDLEDYVRKRRRTVKRGSGLVKHLNVIDHIPSGDVDNPALEALKQL
ncbi:MAG: helix-turn-helix domain-containing protein [Lentilitoribacter sp.]